MYSCLSLWLNEHSHRPRVLAWGSLELGCLDWLRSDMTGDQWSGIMDPHVIDKDTIVIAHGLRRFRMTNQFTSKEELRMPIRPHTHTLHVFFIVIPCGFISLIKDSKPRCWRKHRLGNRFSIHSTSPLPEWYRGMNGNETYLNIHRYPNIYE
jgi:hypothetical protein